MPLKCIISDNTAIFLVLLVISDHGFARYLPGDNYTTVITDTMELTENKSEILTSPVTERNNNDTIQVTETDIKETNLVTEGNYKQTSLVTRTSNKETNLVTQASNKEMSLVTDTGGQDPDSDTDTDDEDTNPLPSSTLPPLPPVQQTTRSLDKRTFPPGAGSSECPEVEDGDTYTQASFLERLTAPCRYDRLTRPGGDVRGSTYFHIAPKRPPTQVHVQIDIRHLEAAEHLQFKLHMLLQYRYRDPRLDYSSFSPGRARIVGEDLLRARVWVPHVLLENERDSAIMGHDAKDIYMAIDPSGEVTYSRRVKATLYCWMDLQKFPFDEQECNVRLLSWTYNASELMLRWEKEEPVVIADQLHLTEYTLLGHWTEEGIKQASRQSRGAFSGNYSSLTFRFHMAREMGYYMLDYFIPSIMLVCISWVSFWLQADASAPRITIGTSTMLSFITLATAQTRNLPKVSYIKASEIWFLGCTIFIFGSMVEFAFVNIIWRRKSNVELKKKNSKYILKSTITPRLHRKELMKLSGSGTLHKSHSCSSLDNTSCNSVKAPQYNNYLTVHGYSSGISLPVITTESVDDLIVQEKNTQDSISITVPNHCSIKGGSEAGLYAANSNQNQTWTTMTPQEISQWIDKRSRLVFPCAFVIFNAFYWGFVYWL